MCVVLCDKCGEAVNDLEKMLFDCALCDDCYKEVKEGFEFWMTKPKIIIEKV